MRVEAILDLGSAKAELVASATAARASDAIGLLPRGAKLTARDGVGGVGDPALSRRRRP